MNPPRNHEVGVRSLASRSGLRIGVAMSDGVGRLGSHVAVALVWANGYSSNWIPSLGTSMCCGCGPKKIKKKKDRMAAMEGGSLEGEREGGRGEGRKEESLEENRKGKTRGGGRGGGEGGEKEETEIEGGEFPGGWWQQI